MSLYTSAPRERYTSPSMALILMSLAGFVGGIPASYAALVPQFAIMLGAPDWVLTASVMALPSILPLILFIPMGIIADNTGRRKELIITGFAVGILVHIALAYTSSWILFVPLRILTGFPFALGAVGGAVLASLVPPEKRGRYFALYSAFSMLLPGAIWMAVGGWLLKFVGSWTNLFLLCACAGTVPILCWLPIKAPRVKIPTRIGRKEFMEVFGNRAIMIVGCSLCLYLLGLQLIYSSYPVVLPLIHKATPEFTSLTFSVISFMMAFGTIIWGPVIDKWGPKTALLIGLSISVIATFAMIPLAHYLWPYIVLFWIANLGGIVGNPASMTVATKSVRTELYTLAINTVNMLVFMPGVISGFISGPLLFRYGLTTLVTISAIFELVALISMSFAPRTR